MKKLLLFGAIAIGLISCENNSEGVLTSKTSEASNDTLSDQNITEDEVMKVENIDGEALYNLKCSKCHNPHKEGTGPKLYNVRKRWLEAGTDPEDIYLWVNDWESAVKKSTHAKTVSQISEVKQTKFPNLSRDQINAIFNWVDEQPIPQNPIGETTGESLFVMKCAVCHHVFKDGTGPPLHNVRKKWQKNGAGDMIYSFVRNWEEAVKKSIYAEGVAKMKPSNKVINPDLSDAQLDMIFDWIDTQENENQQLDYDKKDN